MFQRASATLPTGAIRTSTASPWSQVIERPDPCGHFVQLYQADHNALSRNVGQYIRNGLEDGESVLVIAGPEHSIDFRRSVRDLGGDPEKAISERRLAFFDASTTLSKFMVDGQPDWGLFESTIGEAVRHVHPGTEFANLRAYGEMVGILWKARLYSAAIRLEQFWNKLLSRWSFSLYCSYAIDVFGTEFDPNLLDGLLSTHTHLLPAETEGRLESSINCAMDEILGAKASLVRTQIKASYRPSWAIMPVGETIALWLRQNLPAEAGRILSRARELYVTFPCLQ